MDLSSCSFLHWLFMHFLMSVGLVITMIVVLLVDIVFFLDIILSLSVHANNKLWHALIVNPNTSLLSTRLQKSCKSSIFFVISMLYHLIHLHSSVTTFLPFVLLRIQFFMLIQNIWRLITTSFVSASLADAFIFSLSLPLINL